MDFHIVSGFLGSGKTTAIIAASKLLMAQGQRVGVVTNDQGKYLVDTAFFRLASVPTVEVTGGCFCCNYDNLEGRLFQLNRAAQPDVIFAESVGSCADIVATVVKPLLELQADTFSPTSFSVFTDARMLRRRLLDLPMPFSDDVVYIFDKQIEEAGILVINKKDLFSEDEADHLFMAAHTRYPDKVVRLQNSLDPQSIQDWVRQLKASAGALPDRSLDMDYRRYSVGEQQLAWLDETLNMQINGVNGRIAVLTFLTALMDAIADHNLPVGHLKVLVKGQNADIKLSFVALASPDWQSELPAITGNNITILINARVEGEPDVLHSLVQDAISVTHNQLGVHISESEVSAFHPAEPKPTHRFGNVS